MKVERKQAEQVKSLTGACVGDQVIFSSYHPENHKYKGHMEACGVGFNKLYTVGAINEEGRTQLVGLIDPEWGASENNIGVYDIVVRKNQETAFEPVVITLETQEEANLFASYVGATCKQLCNEFGVDWNHFCDSADNLGAAAPFSTRKMLKAIELS